MLFVTVTIGALMTPLLMIVLGKYFQSNAPKNINNTFGYRTSYAMKSQESWDFAQKHLGNLWFKAGRISLVLVFIVLSILFLYRENQNMIAMVGILTVVAEIGMMIAMNLLVEKALRSNFDNQGKRKKFWE